MEQRISVVTLGVDDLARAVAFYEAMGWRRSMRDANGVAFFQAGGLAISLYPRADMARDGGLDDATGNAIVLSHNVRERAEVDSVLAEAVAAGGEISHPAVDTFWGGYAGAFADPDKHVWEIAWNPGFPMASDGTITLPE
ncbi:MAG: VOC family protein [Alphaproteobacteria bacterium]